MSFGYKNYKKFGNNRGSNKGYKSEKEKAIAKLSAKISDSVVRQEIANIKISDEFKEVFDLMENSNENLFITGRAGTGKSTLLNYFRTNTKKNVVVVAPTGVAALNVRGQTIHSFFKFKIGVTESAIKKIPQDSAVGKIYSKIDTVVIDEISMVRADLFDCVEKFMSLNGKNPGEPFGGAQIIVIGDLLQLPPVVAPGEHYIFESKYESPYFFDSKGYRRGNFETVELTQVYRQSDEDFIEILDRIRKGEVEMSHLEHINRACCIGYISMNASNISNPSGSIGDSEYFQGETFEEAIINIEERVIDKKSKKDKSALESLSNSTKVSVHLVTTNALADKINFEKLRSIKGESKIYKGNLNGFFDERNAPVPTSLELKIGAQVMTLKNDIMGRWVNGDIGIIEKLGGDHVYIRFENGRLERIEGDTWDMVRYQYDDKEDRIVSESVGQYSQLPIKLAWAVTIHKAQGKTFDKAVIDFGKGTFAHGQAYVALSRVRTLGGITLVQPLKPRDIFIDEKVRDFLSGFSR